MLHVAHFLYVQYKDTLPKPPVTAYLQFVKSKQSKLREKHPELGQVDVTRRLAQKWREIGPERRVCYAYVYVCMYVSVFVYYMYVYVWLRACVRWCWAINRLHGNWYSKYPVNHYTRANYSV